MQSILNFFKKSPFIVLIILLVIIIIIFSVLNFVVNPGAENEESTNLQDFESFIQNFNNENFNEFNKPSNYTKLEKDLPINNELFTIDFKNDVIEVRLLTQARANLALEQIYSILKGYSIPPNDPKIRIIELSLEEVLDFDFGPDDPNKP